MNVDVRVRLVQLPGSLRISALPRHSHGWLFTKPFDERNSPDNSAPVVAKALSPHWSVWTLAASRIGMSAGSSSCSVGTRAGLSTVSRLLQAAEKASSTPNTAA